MASLTFCMFDLVRWQKEGWFRKPPLCEDVCKILSKKYMFSGQSFRNFPHCQPDENGSVFLDWKKTLRNKFSNAGGNASSHCEVHGNFRQNIHFFGFLKSRIDEVVEGVGRVEEPGRDKIVAFT